jgi:sugar phosphate isomerase/epimerase
MAGEALKPLVPPADRIAVVSDEIAPDFETALVVGLELGIRAYEIRGLSGGRIPACTPGDVDKVAALAARHGFTITGISPGFFKQRVDLPSVEDQIEAGIDSALRAMDRLGTRRMTVFSFKREYPRLPIPQQVIDRLSQTARRCRQAGVELLVENSASCWGDTGEHLAEILRTVGDGVGATWDPANAQAAGEPAYPRGYAFVRNCIRHVHLKNWRSPTGLAPLLEGEIDLAGQIRALESAGYAGFYCLEPHQWDHGAIAVRLNHAQLHQIFLRENL